MMPYEREYRKRRVVIYARVSTDHDAQLSALENQIDWYKPLLDLHPEWTLVEQYIDEGITGTSVKKRKDFQRMLADCRKGKIDKILVKSISRFARNAAECLETVRELKSLGIGILFEEHNIDTKTVSSEMLTAVLASCAQEESESISKNMRWSVQKRMENGTFNTCRAATGFRLSENGLVVQPDEAPVIQSIFADYLMGKNSREIASKLNEDKALGRVWNRKLVDYILMNERYAGNALLQKKYRTDTLPRIKKPNRGERPMYYVQGSNPAIVPQEIFEQANALRKSRRNAVADAATRPLARKVYCGCCGSLNRAKRVNDIWYWVCRKHEEASDSCKNLPVPEDELTAAFLRLYYNLKIHPEILTFHLKGLTTARNRQMLWSPEVVELNKKISDIMNQSHSLALLNKQGVIGSDILISTSNRLAEQLRKAKQQKENLLRMEDDKTIEITRQIIDVLSEGPDMLESFDEELFCELIDKIVVESNTKIRFRLKNGLYLPESIERTVR